MVFPTTCNAGKLGPYKIYKQAYKEQDYCLPVKMVTQKIQTRTGGPHGGPCKDQWKMSINQRIHVADLDILGVSTMDLQWGTQQGSSVAAVLMDSNQQLTDG